MFIAFEGGEGSGKSVQSRLLKEWLVGKGIDVVLTKEPGSSHSKECQAIRKILLDPDNDLDPMAELFLYWADRAQHSKKIIWPPLINGKWVISDRYFMSTYAYQGCGREMKDMLPGDAFRLNQKCARNAALPNLVFVMDIPVEEGLKRAKESNREYEGGDRIEQEDVDFHKKVRDGFLKIAEEFSRYCQVFVLDATKSIEEIHENIKEIIRSSYVWKQKGVK